MTRKTPWAVERVAVWAAAIVLQVAPPITTAADAYASDKELAATIIAGVRTHVERLTSGIVEFDVANQHANPLAKHFVAFDNMQDKVRSDVQVLFPNPRFVKVIHTKSEFLQFVDNPKSGLLTRLNPGERSIVSHGMPIDVGAVGLCHYSELEGGRSAKQALEWLARLPLIRVAIENDIAVLVVEMDAHGAVRTEIVWWIDTAHDYVPLRCQVRFGSRFLPWSRVKQELETSWGRSTE